MRGTILFVVFTNAGLGIDIMKNPKLNRLIGYIIMFIGFNIFYKGFHTGTAPNGVDGTDVVIIAVGLIFVIAAFVWMFFKVRCPHCNGLLNLKLGNIDMCPYCGESTED